MQDLKNTLEEMSDKLGPIVRQPCVRGTVLERLVVSESNRYVLCGDPAEGHCLGELRKAVGDDEN